MIQRKSISVQEIIALLREVFLVVFWILSFQIHTLLARILQVAFFLLILVDIFFRYQQWRKSRSASQDAPTA